MSRNSGMRVANLHVRGDNAGLFGAHVDSFIKEWARGNPSTCVKGRVVGTTAYNTAVGGSPLNAYRKTSCNEEIIDLGGATSVDSTGLLLPANSLIECVIATVVKTLGTPTSFSVGDGAGSGAPARFISASTNKTQGNVTYGAVHLSGTVATWQAAAAKVRVKPNAAGQGLIQIQVYYRQFLGGQA